MGDVAEMMVEGVLCEICGEFIGEAVGHPRRCGGCKDEDWHCDQCGEPVEEGASFCSEDCETQWWELNE